MPPGAGVEVPGHRLQFLLMAPPGGDAVTVKLVLTSSPATIRRTRRRS